MTSTEAQSDPERRRRLQPFASFRYRNYRWLWAANLTFGLGQSAQGFAFLWLVYEMSGSSGLLGALTVTAALPALLLALPAGVFADRKDRRFLLATSHVLVGLALLLTAAVGWFSLGLTLLMALLAGIGLAIGAPVRTALIPALVPPSQLLNANALDGLGRGVGLVVGLAVAYFIGHFWGLWVALAVSAVAILAGALFVIPLRVPPREPLPTSPEYGVSSREPTSGGMVEDIVDVLDFFAYSKTQVGPLFVLLFTMSILGPWLVLANWEVTNNLDATVAEAGVLFMVMGLGSLASLLALMSMPRLRNAGGWYAAALVAGAILTAAIWLSSSYALTAFLMVFAGLATGIHGVLFVTLVQSRTPIALMGRVMAAEIVLVAAGVLLGLLLGAASGDFLRGQEGLFFAVVALAVVTSLVLVRNPGLRRMATHPEEPEAKAEPSQG